MLLLSGATQRQIIILLISSCLCLSLLVGCGLKDIKEQVEIAEGLGAIKGKIVLDGPRKGPIVVRRYRDRNGIPVLEGQVIASGKGRYGFSILPGKYYIASFVDVNRDGEFQRDSEPAMYHGSPSLIDVKEGQTVKVQPIVITGKLPPPKTEIKEIVNIPAIWDNVGKVTTLDDPKFVRDNYDMGLWRPIDFLETAEGGLFFLQEYQPGKVPVLFVHGVMGGPTDWRTVIESLDKERFQPWVFYYPSGLRLDMISDFLVEAVSRLQNKYGFEHYNVVAHSMGGLVARSFVKKYVAYAPENAGRLRLVMTINSPMAGMAGAASGVKHSPIVIPSWRDVEPASAFLQDLHTWDWPRDIPYHLVVSYENGDSGDGVVPLQSQVPLKLQSESTRMYVFNNDHVGTLSDNNFLGLLNRILKENIKK